MFTLMLNSFPKDQSSWVLTQYCIPLPFRPNISKSVGISAVTSSIDPQIEIYFRSGDTVNMPLFWISSLCNVWCRLTVRQIQFSTLNHNKISFEESSIWASFVTAWTHAETVCVAVCMCVRTCVYVCVCVRVRVCVSRCMCQRMQTDANGTITALAS